MKLVIKRWLSWTIVIALYLPFIALALFLISVPAQNRRSARISEIEVQRRYRELVADGRLEAPAAGLDAVTFSSRHGGAPYAIWFPEGAHAHGQFRYFAYLRRTPDGRSTWYYQDTITKQVID